MTLPTPEELRKVYRDRTEAYIAESDKLSDWGSVELQGFMAIRDAVLEGAASEAYALAYDPPPDANWGDFATWIHELKDGEVS
ncbi:MAG: hypothetical protein M3457_22570 [Chloroflexota bacterium]|nr:hypothetical protein [Chloroflexota bacterium]